MSMLSIQQLYEGILGDLGSWSKKRFQFGSPQGEFDIVVLGVEPLYPEPEYGTAPGFDIQMHQIVSRSYGPVIAIAHQAIQAAVAHTAKQSEVEAGGVCLGSVFRQPDDGRLWIYVEAMIPAEYMANGINIQGKAHLTFTPEAWRGMLETQLRDFPDMRVLGWYHSHPGLGIFLSSLDKFIHSHFFPQPWHIAVVIDPWQQQFGAFARYGQELLQVDKLSWTDEPCRAKSLR